MFHATASTRVRKEDLVRSFTYRGWEHQIQNKAMPHKKIYRAAVLRLERSGSPSIESFVQHLKEKSAFPDKARFTVWIIPYGFHSHQLGNLVFPIRGLSPARVAPLFKLIDSDTMSAYRDSLRTSIDKDNCKSHWVRTVTADARDGIIHNEDDDQYPIPYGF